MVALLMFAGDLSARDEDKDGGKEGGKRGGESRSGGGDRGGSERGGSRERNSGGPQNQIKKGSGELNRNEGFKKLDQDDFRLKTNPGRRDSNPAEKFDKDDRDKGDKVRRDRDDRDRDDRDRDRNDRDRDRDDRDRDRDRHRDDDNWKSWSRSGWGKDNWNSRYNAQHRQRNHGYWDGGRWYPPLILVQRQPVIYLQPRQQAIVGQKWLGVTYDAYDGGGAYVTGIYEGSPAQQIGLEVGDVIVTVDGRDATNLPRALQATDGNITLQVLRGRTGQLAQAQVNIIR